MSHGSWCLQWTLLIGGKKIRHYFYTDLLVWQNFHLPLGSPLPTCFTHWLVCLFEPLWISKSCCTSHDTIYYFLAVWRTTRKSNTFKINSLLDGNSHLLLNWPHMSNFYHFRHKQKYRSTCSLYQLLGRKSWKLSASCSLNIWKHWLPTILGMWDVSYSHHSWCHVTCLAMKPPTYVTDKGFVSQLSTSSCYTWQHK